MIEETRVLLDLYNSGMGYRDLYHKALTSGRFPNITARRLFNIVRECFAPRFLGEEGRAARQLKQLNELLMPRDFEQLLFLYTCRANPILIDFVINVYWPAYAAGRELLTNDEAREFVRRANQEGLTSKPWSDKTIQNVAGYLTGTCADFGLLERGSKVSRKVLPFRIGPQASIVLAYELHFRGLGDNQVVGHPDWSLFGLERQEVLEELKRLSLKGVFIVQAAGEVIRISWPYKSIEELADALA